MASAAAAPSGDGLHFAIPEGTTSISDAVEDSDDDDYDEDEETYSSWKAWGVDKKTVTSVTIPASVNTLGRNAFRGCILLESVAIPSSVTWIEERAFDGCRALVTVAIPSSVTWIEERAFDGCDSLTSVAIPTSMTSIEDGAFQECSALTSVDIPASVTRIEEYAFNGCSSLTSIAIPSSVTSIAEDAFGNCSSLTSAEIPASIMTLGTMRDGTFRGAFEDCTALTVLMIQPIDMNDRPDVVAAADPAAADTATSAGAPAVVKALNEQNQFTSVTKFWASDDVIAGLSGLFEAYTQLKDVPRELLAAPDAKTWAGVQLWLWWLPPILFSEGNIWRLQPYRVACKSRQRTIWATVLGGLRAEESAALPGLTQELWRYMFGFLKHDQLPTFPQRTRAAEA